VLAASLCLSVLFFPPLMISALLDKSSTFNMLLDISLTCQHRRWIFTVKLGFKSSGGLGIQLRLPLPTSDHLTSGLELEAVVFYINRVFEGVVTCFLECFFLIKNNIKIIYIFLKIIFNIIHQNYPKILK
jgi:hypothetical protein